YTFDFSRLDRWLGICRDLGMRSLEIAHLFTQWGARFTPAIQVRTTEGVEDRFGWHVPATSPAYRRLLEALIPALREHLDDAWEGEVLWHISDEPREDQLEPYQAAKEQVADLLEGARVVDALSSYEFARRGVVDTPIVATNHVGPFLEAGQRPWVYYCVSQNRDVANRFIALPSVRNRVLGRQLFAFDAPGFLHWGYNFWWSQFSLRPIDPFEETCAGGGFFGGDAFAVYPGPDGSAWLSIRHRVFAQAMADHRALTWLAELTDPASAKALIEEGGTLTYSSFSYDVGRTRPDQSTARGPGPGSPSWPAAPAPAAAGSARARSVPAAAASEPASWLTSSTSAPSPTIRSSSRLPWSAAVTSSSPRPTVVS